MKMKKICAAVAGGVGAFAIASSAYAALAVSAIDGSTVTPNSMANSLLGSGSGITINSVTYTGVNAASGVFSGGTGIIGFESGIILTSGSAVGALPGANNSVDNSPTAGDPLLNSLTGRTTFDASRLDITFTPTGNNVEFSYVFASEEYNTFVGTQFNDVFAFVIGGTNYALINGQPVAINSVNCGNPFGSANNNCASFRNNDTTPQPIAVSYGGLTTVLSFTAPVTAGAQNTLSLIIADASDEILDSAVFLAGGSFSVCGGPGQDPCGNGNGNGNGNGTVPEPGALGLLAAAALAFAAVGRRQLKQRRGE